MRIYSMAATFGKLQNQTLTFQPGLNIIEAPNEWGKSTWCAFLIAMLYGIATRERTGKDGLAAKEHYLPWSGSPMSGSMDINWNGRNITIQRSTRGRIPMGEFYAFETDTGLAVPELTADNCGQMLLGVERSVFTRSAFLRFADLPVEQDEALRSRLNALVSTGDDSGTAEALAKKLNDLKNKCQSNSANGLLPQALKTRQSLEASLQRQETLLAQAESMQARQAELEQWQAALENHKTALRYAAAKQDAQRIEEAQQKRDAAKATADHLEATCQALPSQQQLEQTLSSLNALQQSWVTLHTDQALLPSAPTVPDAPVTFSQISAEEAHAQACAHRDDALAAQKAGNPKPVLLILGIVAFLIGAVIALAWSMPIGLAFCGIAVGAVCMGALQYSRQKREGQASQQQAKEYAQRYGSEDPAQWPLLADQYTGMWETYRREQEEHTQAVQQLAARNTALQEKTDALTGGQPLHEAIAARRANLQTWADWQDSLRQYQQLASHYDALVSVAKPPCAPAQPDTMTYTEDETNRLLSDAAAQIRHLQQQAAQFRGQAEALGDPAALRRDLEAVDLRIGKLEQTLSALKLAQQTLSMAADQLQRRFAPKITHSAQDIFSRLTDGRYNRLTLGQDLSMQAGAADENTLRSPQWRSDGTVDQLYLALRLAVARELMPNSPMVLDDALVRFDDKRLCAALQLLKEESQDRQILLFTCQNRENALLAACPSVEDVCSL